MGIDRNIFIGAFLECENEKIMMPIYNKICKFCKSVFDESINFCSHCGKALINNELIKEKSINQTNIYNVSTKIDEVLCCNNFNIENSDKDIWYSNLTHTQTHINIENESCIKDINIALIQSSLDEFKKTFKNEIEIIEKAYNGNVSLKFGLIQYYS